MKLAVWDTYVRKPSGDLMHFDVIVPDTVEDQNDVLSYVKSYLKSKSLDVSNIKVEQCLFCHFERATDEISRLIEQNGFYILEMENC